MPVDTDTMEIIDSENTEAAVLALEDVALHCAHARRVLSAVMLQKTAWDECCEMERLAHNHLISQELSADNERMELIMSTHHRTRKETKYQTTA